jgi:mono/diheme cytochrome c family protein
MKIIAISSGFVFTCILLMSFQQPSLKTVMDNGKKVYDKYCLSCHQADGGGVPRMNPPLKKTTWVTGDKQRLISIILKGMDEPLEINGEDFYNVMAPHDFLKDQEIADVLSFVRNSFGNKASLVTAAEVKAVRAQYLKKGKK